ncbi:MAG TPA: hypothetical protein ENN49_07770 [Bacteroidales bacterium]|nr:hypothetical protein [Bacteroidales bacterium]
MKSIAQVFLFLASFVLLCGASCDKYEKGEGITGVWRCRENYQGTKFRSYNVSIDRYTQLDSSTYVIYNLYNLGLDVETYVQLKDTVFTVLSTNSDLYFITGRGVWHRYSQAIDWEYSVSGQVSDPFVSATFDRP